MSKEIKPKYAFVHTLQMKSKEGVVVDPMKHPYLMHDKLKMTQRGFLYPINPNKFIGVIYSYSDLNMIMKSIQEELRIKSWEFDRIDITLDYDSDYADLFKINKYVMSLVSLAMETKNFMDTRGGMNLEKRSLKIPKRKLTVEVYDKKQESKGKHPYTRCEFRFKLLDKKRHENLFEDIYWMLVSLNKYIDKLNRIKTQALYELWCKEKETGKVRKINEFYRKYSDEIYTVAISKALYRKIEGDKKDYGNWIKNLRRSYKIEFISKTTFRSYIKEIEKAIKVYEMG